MNNVNLRDLILGDSPRIVTAISTGAQWEIWMQIELAILLRQANVQVAREVPYPAPHANLKADFIAQDGQGRYVIELKVESATNAGAAVLHGVQQDIQKLGNYNPNPGARWAVGIGYSVPARQALHGFAGANPHATTYYEANGIGVLVVTV